MTRQSYSNACIEGTYDGLDPMYNGLNNDKFKLHKVKLFASADNSQAHLFKDYRTVFDKNELSYLSIEASFHNKLFNQNQSYNSNWYAKIFIRCGRKTDNGWTDVSSFDLSREIKSAEDIVKLRATCGNLQQGSFFQEGTYYWDVWINDKLLAFQYFYINDIGLINHNNNAYFNDIVLKVFDSQKDEHRAIYYTKFKKQSTIDFGITAILNLKRRKPFFAEYFFDIYKNGELIEATKSHTEYIYDVQPNDTSTDFGFIRKVFSNPGNWQEGNYEFKFRFLGVDLITANVEITNNDFEEGEFTTDGKVVKNSQSKNIELQSNKQENTEDFLAELDALIGMDDIKKSIRDHIKYIKFLQLRKQKGFDDDNPILLHSIFTGNPGTGKTTVIRLLGKIYQSLGLLSKGHVHEVDRSNLVGEFIGATAPRTKSAIEAARGGILFIDEAYSLYRKDISSNDFGKEVIETLLKEMTSNTGDLAIMCAGYPKEMDEFLEVNPGLKSRFTHSYHFEDYSPDELMAISEYAAKKNSITLTDEAKINLRENLVNEFRDRSKHFGNARFANSIINKAKMNLAKRLMNYDDISSLSNETLSTVLPEDIDVIFEGKEKKQFKPDIDEKLLQEGLAELNELIGMDNIKQEVNELIQLIRFYKESNKDVLGQFSLHSVFSGNPGTGKTTVARIISKLYKAMGILERGNLVEVDREGLVGGYIGHTAPKTAEKITEAMGGILFIDEAYTLVQKQAFSDFGEEAIQVLLKRMEDMRGKFGVIVAGYTGHMRAFIESNPGLQSRFDKTFHFKDYSPGEMFQISISMLKKDNLQLDEEASIHIKKHCDYLYNNRNEHFGNARTVRNYILEIKRKQNLRMAALPFAQRDEQSLQTITIKDVQHLSVN